MKNRLLNNLCFILLLFPVHLFSQAVMPAGIDITGIWKGELYNDTTQKYLPYEIAISEEKGKLSGYSYTIFDIDGKKEVGVKRVKIIRKDSKIIIEDVELIANDYSAPAPRGVRQMSIVSISLNDTAMLLTGSWQTNRTRQYRPLTGTMHLQRKLNFRPLALFKKLEELKLQNDLSFVHAEQTAIARAEKFAPINNFEGEIKPENEPPAQPAAQPIEDNKEESSFLPMEKKIENSPVSPEPVKAATKRVAKININPVESNKVKEMAIAPPVKRVEITTVAIEPRSAENNPVKEIKIKPVAVLAPKKPQQTPVTVVKTKEIEKPASQKKVNPVVSNNSAPVIDNKTAAVFINKPKPIDPLVINSPGTNNEPLQPPSLVTEKKQEMVVLKPVVEAAVNVAKRKVNNIQSVFYQSDSLTLTLYDNGEIDGDTVSVLMNGKVIISRQGLDTKPNFKTIRISKETPDSIMLVMYAENLGSIPPNTGLLLVHDGDAVYEVRFSADLKTNAAILLRRQKK